MAKKNSYMTSALKRNTCRKICFGEISLHGRSRRSPTCIQISGSSHTPTPHGRQTRTPLTVPGIVDSPAAILGGAPKLLLRPTTLESRPHQALRPASISGRRRVSLRGSYSRQRHAQPIPTTRGRGPPQQRSAST